MSTIFRNGLGFLNKRELKNSEPKYVYTDKNEGY